MVTQNITSSTQLTLPGLPETGYVRLWHVVGDRKRGIPALLPISRSSFLAGIKSGRYKVTPVQLGLRTTAYKVEEIRALLAGLERGR